jgi:hypothetical protein
MVFVGGAEERWPGDFRAAARGDTDQVQTLVARLQARRRCSTGNRAAHRPCPSLISNAREPRRYYITLHFCVKLNQKGQSETLTAACLGSAFAAPQHRGVQFFASGGLMFGYRGYPAQNH